MKTFRMIGMALVAIMLGFTLSSCKDDNNDNFIPVDYSKDLVGTWTCLQPGFTGALEISVDGSVLSTGIEDNGAYWERQKGKLEQENNKISVVFENGNKLEGRFEIIPGKAFSIVETGTGNRFTYDLCKKDLSEEIVGMWVCTQTQTADNNNLVIQTMTADGKSSWTGFIPDSDDMVLNLAATYKVIGDLFIVERPDSYVENGSSKYAVERLVYAEDGTSYGDIMNHVSYYKVGSEYVYMSFPYLRIKQHLELPGQKYDYIKTYVTNASGLDKDFNIAGYTINFSKLDGVMMDKMLKTLLFSIEFPDAKTMKYSYLYNGETVSATAPIEVDGNKMTVKMDKSRGCFRNMDLYVFQDKDNTQMHIYMSKYAFINYFGNIAVSLLAEKGEIDPADQAAVDAVFAELTEIIKTINISFVMSKTK